jgi:hypothetical protein
LSKLGDKSKEVQLRALNDLIPTLQDVPNPGLGAMRPDFLAIPNDGKGSIFYGDFTSIHPTAKSYSKETLNDLVNVAKEDVQFFEDGLKSRFDRCDQHWVAKKVEEKKAKYQFISDLVNLKSNSKGNRNKKMVFVPAVVTHNGQLNFELFDFIEHVVKRFRRLQFKKFDINGRTIQERVSSFRIGFKNSLVFSLANSWGNQLRWGVVRGGINPG